MNKHTIELREGKQPSYRLVYILSPVELETLKIYIETYLKTKFIKFSKSLTSALIFFNKKFDGSFSLYVDY